MSDFFYIIGDTQGINMLSVVVVSSSRFIKNGAQIYYLCIFFWFGKYSLDNEAFE